MQQTNSFVCNVIAFVNLEVLENEAINIWKEISDDCDAGESCLRPLVDVIPAITSANAPNARRHPFPLPIQARNQSSKDETLIDP